MARNDNFDSRYSLLVDLLLVFLSTNTDKRGKAIRKMQGRRKLLSPSEVCPTEP